MTKPCEHVWNAHGICQYCMIRRIDGEWHEFRRQRDVCLEAIRKIDAMLRIPAAEYVPAIGDVFGVIDDVYKQAGIERQA